MTAGAPAQRGVPLWQLLCPVTDIVAGVLAGQSYAVLADRVAPPLRAGAQALSFTVLRGWGRARALRGLLAPGTPPPLVDALLCSALALLWEGTSYPAHTVVDQCVRCARSRRATQHQAGFVNACLRQFLRRREALQSQTEEVETACWNHPQWWIDLLRQDWPQHWQALLHASVRPAPMVLRRNRRRIDQPSFLASLQALGIDAHPAGDAAVVLDAHQPVVGLPGFGKGWFSVQDLGAQRAIPLLLQGDFHPRRVLDACAAPGGKTTHLLEWLDAEVMALDIDPQRCARVRDNLDRLGLHATVLCADALDPTAWWNGQPFDAIMLDAPCTGSGVVRRHPDIPWLKRLQDVQTLSQVQACLLDALWPLLRPGGRLLYATCSVFRAEGSDRIDAFVATHPDACPMPAPGHWLPGVPSSMQSWGDDMAALNDAPWGHDGFFYAVLRKVAQGAGA
ncbi:16S rRNA (cytosine(967)-C(5))-methyltransferase RsmB [Candidatus Symbiobacter mobilis]|uniref:Ribosomal RNA small subunit methyltransferase B n=1 Tax=Candidatus Symbiobacter mobilis CR TaxID=946483 RepID=U5N6X4_9BURK|nr:16S rRNA (cytosine(967)-C(5))-methyltransferase RsmB [Candidatus Symbiobacter mobilis]AGX87132.1 ribosomal RNA small subunit methyltransferase B [Candidatus Symbiobacter mobilis CR]